MFLSDGHLEVHPSKKRRGSMLGVDPDSIPELKEAVEVSSNKTSELSTVSNIIDGSVTPYTNECLSVITPAFTVLVTCSVA